MAPTPASDGLLTDSSVVSAATATPSQGGDMLGTQPSGGMTNHVGIGIGIAVLILVVTITLVGLCWMLFIKRRKQTPKADPCAYKINENPPPYSAQHTTSTTSPSREGGTIRPASSTNASMKELPPAHIIPPRT